MAEIYCGDLIADIYQRVKYYLNDVASFRHLYQAKLVPLKRGTSFFPYKKQVDGSQKY